jgi:diadenylate cyclase
MDIIARWIADFIFFVGGITQSFWENLTLLNFAPIQIAIDIILVSILFYFIFLLLKGSRAVNILIGLSIIGLVFLISQAFNLVALGWLLERFFTVLLVAIPIIFQQELRMGLEKLGHTKLFSNFKSGHIDRIISGIVEACEVMAKEKTGALIVFQHQTPLKEYVDTGVELDAKVSKELLLTTFKKNTPLHDGAVIIDKDRVLAASCILPHTYKNQSSEMGTRHKAALGLSENTDASVIVISEERGAISWARKGQIDKNISLEQLQEKLKTVLKPNKKIKKK